jgi:hypothetical protein
MASPPVVKFLDFGQYKYELTKREKENKRRQRSVTFKEVRLSPKIGQGDFETKVNRAIEFLEDGDRIKEHGVPERAPLLEGKSMHLTVASLHKPKEHEVARPKGRGEAAESGDGVATEPAASTEPAAPAKPAAAAPAQPAAPAAAARPEPAAPAPAAAAASAAATGPRTTESSAPSAPAATGE